MAILPKNVQAKDGRLFVNITLRDIFENLDIDEDEEPLLAEIKRVYEENTKLREFARDLYAFACLYDEEKGPQEYCAMADRASELGIEEPY